MKKLFECKITNPVFKIPDTKRIFLTESHIEFWRSNGYIVEVLKDSNSI